MDDFTRRAFVGTTIVGAAALAAVEAPAQTSTGTVKFPLKINGETHELDKTLNPNILECIFKLEKMT